MRTTTLAIAAAMAAAPTIASADTLTVCDFGCDFTSIIDAIAAADDGDVIQLAAQEYYEGAAIDLTGRAITLRGVTDDAGTPLSILDGASKHRLIYVNGGPTCVVENVWMRNGKALGGGGAVFTTWGNLSVRDCTFSGNQAQAAARAVRCQNPGMAIVGCSFLNHLSTGGPLVEGVHAIHACTFDTFTGTAIGIGGPPSSVSSCVFRDGAIGVFLGNDAVATIDGCHFTSLSQYGVRAGWRSSAVITECAYSDIADTAAACLDCWDLAVDSCTFAGCGAGLSFNTNPDSYADCSVLDSTFTSNLQGIFLNYNDTMHMTGCVYRENATPLTAPVSTGQLYLTNTVVCSNGAGDKPQTMGNVTDLGGNYIHCHCPNGCRTDLDCDGLTGPADLTVILGHWGSANPLLDSNADGLVDGFDLGFLLLNWGPCQ